MNKRSKIRKFVLWLLAILLFIIAAIVGLIQVPAVQTYLMHKVSEGLSESLGTEVKVGKVAVSFPDFAVLEDVLIRDKQKDTMFYIGKLSVALRDLDREDHMIKLRKVTLNRARIYLVKYAGEDDLNVQFLVDYLTPEVLDPNAPVWIAFVDKLILKNSRFIYRDANYPTPPEDRFFNESEIVVNGIDAVIRSFKLINDSITMDIRQMSASEQSGLVIEDLRSKMTVAASVMDFRDLNLKTPYSEIKAHIAFTYDGYGMLSDFIDSVTIKAQLSETELSIKDIAWFTRELSPYEDQHVFIETDFEGTVSEFSANQTGIRFGKQGSFKGDVHVKGLPEYDTSELDVVFSELVFNGADISEAFHIDDMPGQVLKLGTCRASGSFKGRIDDFRTAIELKSDAGDLETTLQFSRRENAPDRYSGKLDVHELNLGLLFDDPRFGTTSLSMVVKEGKGTNQKDLKAIFEGKVHHAKIGDYDYKGIAIDGYYSANAFTGTASIDDENAQITFDGKVDLNNEVPVYQFAMDIRHLDLMKLGLDKVPTDIKARIGCEMTGKGMNDLNGNLMVANLEVNREGRKVKLNVIEMFAGMKDNARYLSLYSDVADIQLTGEFDLNNLERVYAVFLNDLFPDYYENIKPLKQPVDIDLRLLVHSSNFITELLDSQFIIGPGVFIGRYSSERRSLTADARISTLKYGDLQIDRIDLNIIKEPGELLNMSTNVDVLFNNKEQVADNIVFNASIMPNQIDFLFNFGETEDEMALRSYGSAAFTDDTIILRLEESFFYVNGKSWSVQNGNQVIYTMDEVNIKGLRLFDENQWIDVNGVIGKNIGDSLVIELQAFELNNLNPVLAGTGIEVSGRTNGEIYILQALSAPVYSGKIRTENLYFNGDTLGDVHLAVNSKKANPMLLRIEGEIQNGLLKDIQVKGDVDLRPEKHELALKVQMTNGSVVPFEPFLEGELTNLSGTVSMDVNVTGKLESPEIKGKVNLQDVGMTIAYFNSRYTVSGPVTITKNKIEAKNNSIQDEAGHVGKLNGTVSHENFSNFVLDVKVTGLQDFVAMKTTKKDNDYFYGSAIVDGNVEVSGPFDNIYVKVYAKSKKGTHIRIPLSYENTNVSESYIQFVELDEEKHQDAPQVRQKIEGFTMDLLFDVTPTAQIDLIFDESINDVITGRGSGTIRMQINSFGDFYMFGEYVIEEGSYPYKAYFISEDFSFKKGGTIRWDGDPYGAKINMEAFVRKSADPSALLSISDQADVKTIPVDCLMKLSGDLFSPEIKFDLEFPNITSNVSRPSEFMARINEIKANEDELNRQFFAVLALGAFLPPEGSDGSGLAVISGIGQQSKSSISGILNRYMNQMIEELPGGLAGFEVGFNWENATAEERDQVRVNVKKELIDEKLVLDIGGTFAGRSESDVQSPLELKAIYSVTPDGRIKIQAFYKRANDPTSSLKNTTNQAGVGFYIRKEMDSISFRRKKKEKKEKKTEKDK